MRTHRFGATLVPAPVVLFNAASADQHLAKSLTELWPPAVRHPPGRPSVVVFCWHFTLLFLCFLTVCASS
jgi:hypothetical protein